MSEQDGSAAGGQPGGAGAAGGTAPWYAMEGMPADQVAQLGEVVQAKGWKGPTDALLSYVNLEKVFGADKAGRTITLPKGDDDVDGRKAMLSRLGWPETPDGYGLQIPEGPEGEFARSLLPILHAEGATTKQAQALMTKLTGLQQQMDTQRQDAFLAQADADYAALKSEWGTAAPQNEELARRAAATFLGQAGIDEAGLAKIEQAIGTAPLLKLFQAIGSKFSEGTFVDGEGQGSGAMTPSQAQAAMNAKFGDKDFMERYQHPDPKVRQTAIEEITRLQLMAHPELQQAS